MASQGEPSGRETFAAQLRQYRARAGLSLPTLGQMVGADPSYLNRLERGEREPPRAPLVEALIAALRLSPEEADAFRVAAGLLPRAMAALGPLDPTLRLVAEVLADPSIPLAERQRFRAIIHLVAATWRPQAAAGVLDPAWTGGTPAPGGAPTSVTV